MLQYDHQSAPPQMTASRCVLHANEAHNLLEFDEYTLRCLTDDGIQRLRR